MPYFAKPLIYVGNDNAGKINIFPLVYCAGLLGYRRCQLKSAIPWNICIFPFKPLSQEVVDFILPHTLLISCIVHCLE